MKTFFQLRNEYEDEQNITFYEELDKYLEEKLLIVGKGANYGQAVILAGGAGSGKSFAATNLMQGEKFKIFNPDDIKDMLLKMRDNLVNSKTGLPKSQSLKDMVPVLQDLDLLNPDDTGKLHMLVKGMKAEHKKLAFFFTDKTRSVLPNVMFDATLKDMGALTSTLKGDEGVLHWLKLAGYKPENIHIVSILTDYKIAMQQNLTRERVVPSEILFQTHRGAAGTMKDILFSSYPQLGINGDVAVIMGGKNNTIELQKGGEYTYKSGPNRGKTIRLDRTIDGVAIMDFKYFRVKNAGSRSINRESLVSIVDYIRNYAPTPTDTAERSLHDVLRNIAKSGGKQVHPTTLKAIGIST